MATFIQLLERYYYFVLVFILILLVCFLSVFRKAVARYKLQPEHAPLKLMFRDTLISLVATPFFLPAGLICSYVFITHGGFTYLNLHEHGLCYFALSVFLVLLVFDAHFYWVHRLLHTPFLFKHVHYVHHKSRNTTVLTFLAMHPIELFLYSVPAPLTLFLFPVMPEALIIGQIAHISYSIYGHSGYEFMSSKGITRWINGSFSHYNHHQEYKTNFGFYFVFWDVISGTLGKNYWRDFDAFTKKRTASRRE